MRSRLCWITFLTDAGLPSMLSAAFTPKKGATAFGYVVPDQYGAVELNAGARKRSHFAKRLQRADELMRSRPSATCLTNWPPAPPARGATLTDRATTAATHPTPQGASSAERREPRNRYCKDRAVVSRPAAVVGPRLHREPRGIEPLVESRGRIGDLFQRMNAGRMRMTTVERPDRTLTRHFLNTENMRPIPS